MGLFWKENTPSYNQRNTVSKPVLCSSATRCVSLPDYPQNLDLSQLLKRQIKIAADDILIFYFYLSKKLRLDFSGFTRNIKSYFLLKTMEKYLYIHVINFKEASGRFYFHFLEVFEKCIEYIRIFFIHFREILKFG